MQRRIGALVAAAVAVLGAVVVLFIRVHAEPEPPLSEEALREAKAAFERQSRAAEAPAASTPTIPPPRVPPPAEEVQPESAARSNTDAPTPRLPPTRASGLRRENLDRSGSAQPSDDPEVAQKRQVVSEAYDHGDFEAASRAAEDFLHLQADDAYVKRVAAVSACALGNHAVALKHYQEATEANKRIIKLRCNRYGLEL